MLWRVRDLSVDKIKITDLYENIPFYLKDELEKHIYPWEVLPHIKCLIKEMLESIPQGYRLIADGVLAADGVRIDKSAHITGPAIIGRNTEIRPSAYLRGNVIIGEGCVVGNSTELKNCILMDGVAVPHYNYVGDSILGSGSHLGAGTVCSNLKSDKEWVVIRGEKNYETRLRKVGAFLGDGADVGCSSVLNPGTVVGKNTRVYPLTSLRGVYPEESIVKGSTEWCVRY